MLSCGKASTPALQTLLRHEVAAITVSESQLTDAIATLLHHTGVKGTESGSASLAGLLKARADANLSARLQLNEESRVLVMVTEGMPAN